jgi:DNA-binding transcriptional ArsR family regulator
MTETQPVTNGRRKNGARNGFSSGIEPLTQHAGATAEFLKALAHETRLTLLCLLAERERSVTELENLLSLRQPAVSQQLARLRLDGLVATRREGKVIYYRLNGDDIHAVIIALRDVFWKQGSGALALRRTRSLRIEKNGSDL